MVIFGINEEEHSGFFFFESKNKNLKINRDIACYFGYSMYIPLYDIAYTYHCRLVIACTYHCGQGIACTQHCQIGYSIYIALWIGYSMYIALLDWLQHLHTIVDRVQHLHSIVKWDIACTQHCSLGIAFTQHQWIEDRR